MVTDVLLPSKAQSERINKLIQSAMAGLGSIQTQLDKATAGIAPKIFSKKEAMSFGFDLDWDNFLDTDYMKVTPDSSMPERYRLDVLPDFVPPQIQAPAQIAQPPQPLQITEQQGLNQAGIVPGTGPLKPLPPLTPEGLAGSTIGGQPIPIQQIGTPPPLAPLEEAMPILKYLPHEDLKMGKTPVESSREAIAYFREQGRTPQAEQWLSWSFLTEQQIEKVFNQAIPIEQLYPQTVEEIEQSRQNLAGIREIGRTPEAEAALYEQFPDLTDQELENIFNPDITLEQLFAPPPLEMELPRLLSEAIPGIHEGNLDAMLDFYGNNPEQLREAILRQGRNQATEAFVRYVHPDAVDEQIDEYFNTEQELGGITTEGQYIDKGFFGNLWDQISYATPQVINKSMQYLTTVLPAFMFPDVQVGQSKISGISDEQAQREGLAYTPEEASLTNQWAREKRDIFRATATEKQAEHEEWLAKHKDLEPPAYYKEGPFKHPDLWTNAGYWGATIGESLPFTLGVLATVLGTTFVTKNPMIGIAAGTAFATPYQSQDLYDDLVASGAPEGEAAKIAVPVGAVIASVEAVTDLPLVGAIFQPLKLFGKQLFKELGKRTTLELIKRGIKTFSIVEIVEVLEEIAQGAIQNAFVQEYDKDRAIFENIDTTIGQTLIATAPFALFGGAMSTRSVRPAEAVKVPHSQKQSEGWVKDEMTGVWYKPTPIMDIYTDAKAEARKGDLSAKEVKLKALNEVARTPEGEQIISDKADEIRESVTPAAGIPTMITAKMQTQLKDLGYDEAVINKMKPQEALDIINKPQEPTAVPKPQEPVAPVTPEVATPTYKVLGRTPSGEANLVTTEEGVLLERIATGKQKGWWKTIVGETEYVAQTRERVLEIARERGAILPKAEAVTPEVTPVTGEIAYNSLADKEAHIADLEKRLAGYEKSIATEPTAQKIAQRDIIKNTLGLAREAVVGEVVIPKAVPVMPEAVTLEAKLSDLYQYQKDKGLLLGKPLSEMTLKEKERYEVWLAAQPEPVMPETGLQPSMIEGVPEVEVANADQVAREQYDELQKMADIWKRKQDTYDNIRQRLYDVAKKAPIFVRGKMLAAMKNVKNEKQLSEAITRVTALAEQYLSKQLRVQIRKEINRTKPKKVRGIPQGKLTADVQEYLDVIRQNLDMDRETATEKIAANIQSYQSGTMSEEVMYEANSLLNLAGIDFQTSSELQNTLDDIRSFVDYGKADRAEQREARKARLDAVRTEAGSDLTGGKGLKEGRGTVPAKELEATKGWLDKLVNANYGLTDLFDKLSKFAKSKPFQSVLNRTFDNAVSEARNAENLGLETREADIKTNAKLIFGVKKQSQINRILNKLSRDEVSLGTFVNGRGETVNLVLTKDRMMSKYQQLQDPTLDETFRITDAGKMAWTQEMIDAVDNNLTTQEKAFADWILGFYGRYHSPINEVFRDKFGVNLAKNPFHSPIRRDFTSEEQEPLLFYRDVVTYATTTNGSLKSRVRNTEPLKFNGAMELLVNHIVQMEHFMAWTGVIGDLRSVFGDKNIQTAIYQYHGKDVYNKVLSFIDDLARGGIEKAKINRSFDWIRRNFTFAALGIKPAISLKQIPSVMAYMTEMPTADFFGGVIDFWTNPLGNFQFLKANSTNLRNRWGSGYERDIKFAIEQQGVGAFTGQKSIRASFLGLIRLGDKLATVQGTWAKYKSELRKGATQADAIIAAEQATDRTQPTANLESLSALQRGGSSLKLITMFQNQLNKYFRIMGNNARNLQYGRGGRAKAASNILLVWVVLPSLFQIIADAFQWKPERQARAWVLGPINNILIFGTFAKALYDWTFTKDRFDYEATPVFQTFQDILNLGLKTRKLIEAGNDPYENITLDDFVQFAEYAAKTAGQLFGLPTPYLVQAERAIREGKPMELIFSRWSLLPPKNIYRETKEEEGKLGLTEEGEELPLTNEEAKPYTMSNLNSYFRNEHNHVLPSDILKDEKASLKTKAWAEKEQSTHESGVLPDMNLYKINTVSDDGDTIIEYSKQWEARKQIDNLADLEEFDKLYPNANLGNISPNQKSLLIQYMNSTDKRQFKKDHPELDINPKTEWLKANPKGNALQAVFGEVHILTAAAYNEAALLIAELDIPDAALPNIPPQEIAPTHFARLDAVADFGANSAEAQLILAKDRDDNDSKYTTWAKLTVPDKPVRYYELKVETRTEREYEDRLKDKDDLYVEDWRERMAALRKEFGEDTKYYDSEYEAEALADATLANGDFREGIFTHFPIEEEANAHLASWIEYKQKSAEFDDAGPEAQLVLANDPEMRKWAGLEAPENPTRYYEIKSDKDFKEQNKFWEELGKKKGADGRPRYGDSTEDAEAKEAAFYEEYPQTEVDGVMRSEYFDNFKRTEALSNNQEDDVIIEQFVDMSRKAREFGGGSREVRLDKLKNSKMFQWLIDEELAEPAGHGSEWARDVLELQVTWGISEDKWEAYTAGGERYLGDSAAAEKLNKAAREGLEASEIIDDVTYGEARRRIAFLTLVYNQEYNIGLNTADFLGYADEYVDYYVNNHDTTLERKTFLLDPIHDGFYKNVWLNKDMMGKKPVSFSKQDAATISIPIQEDYYTKMMAK